MLVSIEIIKGIILYAVIGFAFASWRVYKLLSMDLYRNGYVKPSKFYITFFFVLNLIIWPWLLLLELLLPEGADDEP